MKHTLLAEKHGLTVSQQHTGAHYKHKWMPPVFCGVRLLVCSQCVNVHVVVSAVVTMTLSMHAPDLSGQIAWHSTHTVGFDRFSHQSTPWGMGKQTPKSFPTLDLPYLWNKKTQHKFLKIHELYYSKFKNQNSFHCRGFFFFFYS